MGWQDDPVVAAAASAPWEADALVERRAQPRAAKGVWESMQAGYQGSYVGLANRGKLPDVVLDKESSKWYERVAAGATQLAAEMPAMIAGGVLGGAVSLWMVQRQWLLRAASLLGMSSLAMTQIALNGHEVLSPLYSAYHMAERVKPLLSSDTPFYSVNTFDHSLPFYLGRTVTMVSYKDELSQSIAWQPGDFIPDMKSFAAIWTQQREAYAVYAANDYDNPATHPTMPHRLIMRDPRRVLIGTVNAAPGSSAR